MATAVAIGLDGERLDRFCSSCWWDSLTGYGEFDELDEDIPIVVLEVIVISPEDCLCSKDNAFSIWTRAVSFTAGEFQVDQHGRRSWRGWNRYHEEDTVSDSEKYYVGGCTI